MRVEYHCDGQEPVTLPLDRLLRRLLIDDGVSIRIVDTINAEVELLGHSRGTHELGNFVVRRAKEGK